MIKTRIEIQRWISKLSLCNCLPMTHTNFEIKTCQQNSFDATEMIKGNFIDDMNSKSPQNETFDLSGGDG